MIERYAVVAGRIRQDLADLARIVNRVERGLQAAGEHGPEQDLFFDAVALNLHDFYSGLERIFERIASTVDRSLPDGRDWHRELVRQMSADVSELRPPVISTATAAAVDEYLRFRHVVRHVYAFELLPDRLEPLAQGLVAVFQMVRDELIAFAEFLEGLARES